MFYLYVNRLENNFYDKFENLRRDYKNKEDKRYDLQQKIYNLDKEIYYSEQRINHINRLIEDDESGIAASGAATIFTLGFSGFGIAHCMDSKKRHEKQLRFEKDRLNDLIEQKTDLENQLKYLR